MKNILTLLVLVAMLPGCKKLIENEEEKKFPFHFTAVINDKDVKYQSNDDGSDIVCVGWHDLSATGTDNDALQGTMFLDPSDEAHNVLSVGVLKYFNHEPTEQEQVAMFHLGAYAYGVGHESTSTVNGAVVTYTDSNGKFWSSELGSQTGSAFSISEIENISDVVVAKNFRATFSCKLYDGQGNSIPVNGAEIRGKLFYQ
jgi:hypothetical protein